MADQSQAWLPVAVVIAVLFAAVAIVAGFWLFAPIVLIGLAVLVVLRLRRGPPRQL